MNKTKIVLSKVWKVLRWVLLAAVIMFVLDFAIGYFALQEQHQYALQLAEKFKTDHIAMDDVMGKNLPPEPDQKVNDSTLEGIDVNHDGIRDDVELAIFKLHPDSARIRAAELQYAKALQYEFDPNVYTGETWKVVKWDFELSGGYCVTDAAFDMGGVIGDKIRRADFFDKEVEGLVFNTDHRRQLHNHFESLAVASVGSLKGEGCDVQLSSLAN